VLSSKASFEFKGLFDVILLNLRERNAASGGEEMLRLRTYEKLQSLVSQGAVTRTVTGVIKKYKGVGSRMAKVSARMKLFACRMEREASGQGGCCGLILPLFVLDVRRRTGTGVGL
jgi:hypothetical protein